MTKFSIIIPIYNAEKSLRKCIDGVVSQTFHDFELILVDDGSTDKSLEICNNYAITDSRITIISQKNSGVSSARNRGIETAKGEWITFIDADDYVDNKYLECFCQHISDINETLIIQGYTNIVKGEANQKVIYSKRILESKDFGRILEIYGAVWGKLYNSSIIRKHNIKFDIEISYSEDTIFLLEYAIHCKSIIFSECVEYNYVINENGLSSKFNHFDSEIKLFKRFDELTAKLSAKASCELTDRVKRDKAMLLMRSIYCMYIHRERTQKQRIRELRNIKGKYKSLIKQFYTPNIRVMKLLKTIFFLNLYLYDFACCIKFNNTERNV